MKKAKPKFYSVVDAAIVLGLQAARVREMCANKEIAGQKIGPVWMIPADQLEKARRRKTKPGPVAGKKGKKKK